MRYVEKDENAKLTDDTEEHDKQEEQQFEGPELAVFLDAIVPFRDEVFILVETNAPAEAPRSIINRDLSPASASVGFEKVINRSNS